MFNILFNQSGSEANSSFSFPICMNQNPTAGIAAEHKFKTDEQKMRTASKQRLKGKHFISLENEREYIELNFKIDIYTIFRESRIDLNEFGDICK